MARTSASIIVTPLIQNWILQLSLAQSLCYSNQSYVTGSQVCSRLKVNEIIRYKVHSLSNKSVNLVFYLVFAPRLIVLLPSFLCYDIKSSFCHFWSENLEHISLRSWLMKKSSFSPICHAAHHSFSFAYVWLLDLWSIHLFLLQKIFKYRLCRISCL